MIIDKSKQSLIYRTTSEKSSSLNHKTLYVESVSNGYGGTTRYYSGVDAEIYFGDIFIDDIASFAFSVQQPAQPLFGYNSYTYDDVARGARIINGEFQINFTKSNYMYEVLNTLSQIEKIESDVTTSDHAPLWNKTLDIYISYGDARTNKNTGDSILLVKGIVLTGCSQQLDYSGNPIIESYSFIAKNIEFLNETNNFSESSGDNGEVYVDTENNSKDNKTNEGIEKDSDITQYVKNIYGIKIGNSVTIKAEMNTDFNYDVIRVSIKGANETLELGDFDINNGIYANTVGTSTNIGKTLIDAKTVNAIIEVSGINKQTSQKISDSEQFKLSISVQNNN